jgi:hypothetical protein
MNGIAVHGTGVRARRRTLYRLGAQQVMAPGNRFKSVSFEPELKLPINCKGIKDLVKSTMINSSCREGHKIFPGSGPFLVTRGSSR